MSLLPIFTNCYICVLLGMMLAPNRLLIFNNISLKYMTVMFVCLSYMFSTELSACCTVCKFFSMLSHVLYFLPHDYCTGHEVYYTVH